MTRIGEVIKRKRILENMTQDELAEASNLSLRTIQRIENLENEPRGHSLRSICRVLGLTPNEILDFHKYEDKRFLILLHLSVLCYLVLPLGNIILPLILWITKRESIINADFLGKNILNFQLSWTLVSYTIFVTLAYFKIQSLGPQILVDALLFFSIVLYSMTALFAFLLAIKTYRTGKPSAYPLIVKMIK